MRAIKCVTCWELHAGILSNAKLSNLILKLFFYQQKSKPVENYNGFVKYYAKYLIDCLETRFIYLFIIYISIQFSSSEITQNLERPECYTEKTR